MTGIAVTRIKVCCIADRAEAATAVAGGADAIGLVGAMATGPGVLPEAEIGPIAASVPPPVSRFWLTGLESAVEIAEGAARLGADTVQLVRHADPALHDALARLSPGLRRVQVVHVEGPEAVGVALGYGARPHALLLDSGRPDAGVLGGTGQVHDWGVSAEIVRRAAVPVWLAGGLTSGNVGEAIARVRPFGVDLCSGIRVGGRRDAGLLSAFVAAVRAAQ